MSGTGGIAGQALPEQMAAPRTPTTSWVRGLLCGVLLILLAQVAYGVGIGFGLAVPAPDQTARGVTEAVVAAAAAAGVIALALALLVHNRRHDFRPFGLMLPVGVLRPLLIVLALFLPVTVVLSVITQALGLTGSTTPDFGQQSRSFTILFVTIAIAIAPWVEEISMRGLVYSSLARRFGFWPAALASALIWSGAHLVAGVLLVLAGEGVLLAYLRSRTGSLLPGVALHATQNTLVSIFAGVGLLVLPPVLAMLATLALAWSWLRRRDRAATAAA